MRSTTCWLTYTPSTYNYNQYTTHTKSCICTVSSVAVDGDDDDHTAVCWFRVMVAQWWFIDRCQILLFKRGQLHTHTHWLAHTRTATAPNETKRNETKRSRSAPLHPFCLPLPARRRHRHRRQHLRESRASRALVKRTATGGIVSIKTLFLH